MTQRLVVAAFVLACACNGASNKPPGIHRELHGKSTTTTGLPTADAKPSLEITGVTEPIADAVRARLQNVELVKKGAIKIEIQLDPQAPPASGSVRVSMHIQGVFALPPNVVKTEDTETGELVYDHATPIQIGSELGAAALGYLTGLSLPLGEIQPPGAL